MQHAAPATAARQQAPTPRVVDHRLSPVAPAEPLAEPDTDPAQDDLRAVEDEPADTGRIGDAPRDDGTGWGSRSTTRTA